jgi:hypothetical protein
VVARSVVWRMRVRRCWGPDGILGALVVEYEALVARGIERRVAVRRRGAFVKRLCDILGWGWWVEDDGWEPEVGVGVFGLSGVSERAGAV